MSHNTFAISQCMKGFLNLRACVCMCLDAKDWIFNCIPISSDKSNNHPLFLKHIKHRSMPKYNILLTIEIISGSLLLPFFYNSRNVNDEFNDILT